MNFSKFSQKAVALFFERLRGFIQKAHVMVLVSFQPVEWKVRQVVDLFGDLVFNIESIFANYDYEDFEGLLSFTKLL